MEEKTNDNVTKEQLSASYAALKKQYEADGKSLTTSWPSTVFLGEIVDRNDHYAVQQISSDKHVAHIDTSRSLVKGATMAVSYNQQSAQTIRNPEDQKNFEKEQYKDFSKGSYAHLKGIAKSEIGSEVKVYVPKAGGDGYQGKIIGLTDIHALQRCGKNSAVVHTLRHQDPENTFSIGADLKVTYGQTLKTRTVEPRQMTQSPTGRKSPEYSPGNAATQEQSYGASR